MDRVAIEYFVKLYQDGRAIFVKSVCNKDRIAKTYFVKLSLKRLG
jgi:hypothetical protein